MSARRVDANQAEIVAVLRAAGCSVLDLHEVGADCPDLLVAAPNGTTALGSRLLPGANVLLEVKSARGRLEPGQVDFFGRWPGPKAVVRSPVQALQAMGIDSVQMARVERRVAQSGR